MGGYSLVPTPLSEKSRRGLATVPYNGLSRAVCTVRANQIAEFSYVTLIAWDSLCSPILRSGTCSVHYVMHCKRDLALTPLWRHRKAR